MGKVKIDKLVFNKVKETLKQKTQSQTAKQYGLSPESIRLVNKASSWRMWKQQLAQKRLARSLSLEDVKLEYEDMHSNWFINKLRAFKR